jgi:class 3 adenylate cyclase/Pyruvate/2-oxoacid:ferredoxin oxidoreductase delta subunit/tetratricopeptide (TPR) repeat protein
MDAWRDPPGGIDGGLSVDCKSCGDANRPGARFCGNCGKPLAVRCPACGTESDAARRFCDACGASLVAPPAPTTETAEARKVVTIVFADLIGSTSLHERLDAESARHLMDRYYRALHTVVDAHAGTMLKLLGDGVLAAFGVPRVAENDAIRAVRAAVAIVEAVKGLAVTVREERSSSLMPNALSVRVAVNTGEVVVSPDNTDIVGDPVNVAARLQQEARDGEVLIGESTRRLVGELVTLARYGDLALKGRVETVAAYRVVSLERPAGAAATAFVGRDEELHRLMAVYAAAVAARGARLALVLGSPGLGKSRLLAEFSHRVGERTTVLAAQVDAAGGATFAPLARAIRRHLCIDDASSGDALRAAVGAAVPSDDTDHSRITSGITALLAGTPAAPEETFFVVRRLLGGFAGPRPVVVAIDDLQWAEPLLLDLIEHLVQWTTGVPLLVLVAARPELRDVRPSLAAAGGLVADVVTLTGLDAGAATRLAANVIGAEALPAAVAGRVLATSEGNPLFLGELVRMLVNDGILTREGDRWTTSVALSDLDMPPTIHALLAARIERLRPEDRAVLERAAVVGRQFSRAAVAHLLPREAQDDLDARLAALRRSELIEPDAAWFLGEPALRFHHNLIRDAAYRRLLKGTRAEQHGRIADWIEARVGESVEYDEMIGWHLEQAHQHLRELGPIDEHGRAFGERAARSLAAAGRRALARDDVPVAASLLGRALDRLDDADPTRADLALDWCEALLAAGNVGQAATAVTELGRWIGDDARLRAWHTCLAGQLAVLTEPQTLRTTAEAVAAAAAALAAAGDAAGEAKAHSVHALALVRLGKIGAGEAALDRALAAARRGQDRRRANAVLAGAPLAALWGPSPVTRASGRCLDVVRVLRITQGAPAVEAVALRCQAVLEALRARSDAARRMIASSRSMVQELGITQRLLEADVFAGLIELLDGDAAAAERSLRSAYDGLRAHGLGIDAAQAAALLGRALLAQDRVEEAEALSHDSEALAGDDLKAAIAWRGVRAEALARRGVHASAVDLARAAVDIAAATDALLDHADARRALAAALRASGRNVEAGTEEARAIELWEAKGATLLAERARHDGGQIEPEHRAFDERTAAAHAGQIPRCGERVPSPVDPLAADAPAARFANAATRAAERFQRCWSERDWTGLIASFGPSFHMDDRRALVGFSLSGEDFLANLRMMVDMPASRWRSQLRATRGERLALLHTRLTGKTDTQGVVQFEHLSLLEVDATGQYAALVLFDPDSLDGAYAELDARYAVGEGAQCATVWTNLQAFHQAAGTGDRQALTALLPDDFSLLSQRRLVSSGRRLSRDEYIDSLRYVEDLGLHAEFRLDHVRISTTGAIGVSMWRGTRDGGAFETLLVFVLAHDGQRFHAWELFEIDQLDAALARFEELSSASRMPVHIENAATRAAERLRAAWNTHDWEGVVALFSPGFRSVDRGRLVRLVLERDRFLESLRLFFAMTAQSTTQVLATRGDRLALIRVCWRGASASVGPSDLEFIGLLEVDGRGEIVTAVQFDTDDGDAACAELDERYAAAAATARRAALTRAFTQAFAGRDWNALAALLAPDLVVEDHRLLGWELLHGPAAYIHALEQLVDLAPDVRLRVDHLTMSDPRFLYITTWVGTHEGGAFETPSVIVCELDATDRIRRFDQYDLDQIEEARAQVEATGAADAAAPADSPQDAVERTSPDALRIPPNAATHLRERLNDAFMAKDGDAMRAGASSELVFEDRRKFSLIRGGVDLWIKSAEAVQSMQDVSFSDESIGVFGERIEVRRRVVTGTSPDGEVFESEFILLTEIDEGGRLTASINFDPQDRRAAFDEAQARFLAGEAAPVVAARGELGHDRHGRTRMAAIDIIKRRLKEERIPEAPWPDEVSEKKKRPREVAFMDVNLCFPCGKCPEFCPVQCIEYLAPNTLPGRGLQPVQDRFQECIGCYICVEVCALLTDYDAVRMYDVALVEELLGVTVGDGKPDAYIPAQPYEEYFSEGGARSVRHLGHGSRIWEKMNEEERRVLETERVRG